MKQQRPSTTEDVRRKAMDSLCTKDPRYTYYADTYDPEDHPVPRVDCCCDNCHYGRDELALHILELLEDAPK